jgi:hypothetical protein
MYGSNEFEILAPSKRTGFTPRKGREKEKRKGNRRKPERTKNTCFEFPALSPACSCSAIVSEKKVSQKPQGNGAVLAG